MRHNLLTHNDSRIRIAEYKSRKRKNKEENEILNNLQLYNEEIQNMIAENQSGIPYQGISLTNHEIEMLKKGNNLRRKAIGY